MQAEEMIPRNISHAMSFSTWTISGLHSWSRYSAVCQIAKGTRNSTHNRPPETSCDSARTDRTPSIRRIWAAMTALKGTSRAHAKRLITSPSRIVLVCSLNWATNAARDLAGLGGGMKWHRNANAEAQTAIMNGPHHTHSRWAVRFMLGIGRPPGSVELPCRIY